MTLATHLDPDLQTTVLRLLTDAASDGRIPGGQAAIAIDGELVTQVSAGVLATHDASGSPLTGAERSAVQLSSLYDLASISKFFTAITMHVLVERGHLGYDEPLATHLPSYDQPGRDAVTLRMLLTHTAGLPAIWQGWREPLERWGAEHPGQTSADWNGPSREALIEQILTIPLENAPLTEWVYSCVGYNTAMLLAEAVTGRAWGEVLRDLTLEPLGLAGPGGLTHSPDPSRTAATEIGEQRGLIVGRVHDEAAWSLGGGAGNAGLFGSASTLMTAVEALRTDDLPCASDSLWTNELPALLVREVGDPVEAPWGHSMGLRIGQVNWMSGPEARGHTGFTGTSFLTDRDARLSVVVLTNRVHPSRDGDIVHTLRRAIAEAAYAAAGR